MKFRYNSLAGTFMLAGMMLVNDAQAGITPAGKGFIMNAGQWPADVVALARTEKMDVWVKRNGMMFDQHGIVAGNHEGIRTDAIWENASASTAYAENRSGTPVTIFHGRGEPVRTQLVDKVTVRGMYNGVSVVYMIDGGHVRFDIEAATARQAQAANLFVRNAAVSATSDATLRVVPDGAAGTAVLELANLRVFQQGRPMAAAFGTVTVSGGVSIRFEAPAVSPSLPILIDPIVYGTYVGSAGEDSVRSIRRLSNGSIAVLLHSPSLQYTGVTGGYKGDVAGGTDVLVALYDSTLSTPTRYTYIGGNGADVPVAMAVDASSNIVVTGETTSSDFPVSSGAASQVYKAQVDAFVFKLSADLTILRASTYIGGNKDDNPLDVTVDLEGNMYVCGSTTSSANFPTNIGYQKTLGGLQDAFLTKIASSGAAFLFSTYMGKEGIDVFTGVTIDGTSTPVVCGWTNSSSFPTFPPQKPSPPFGPKPVDVRPFDRTYNGMKDAIVVQFGSDGGTLNFSTYLGGKLDDLACGLFTDATGKVYVVGETSSTDFPVITGAHTPNKPGGASKDVFLAVLTPITTNGQELDLSTYFGGSGDDYVKSITRDETGAAVIVGYTTSSNLPTLGAGTTSARQGANDAYIAVMNPGSVKFASYIGGTGTELITSVCMAPQNDFYIAGVTNSPNLGLSGHAYQAANAGLTDGFIAKVSRGTMELTSPRGGESICLGANQNISWTATEMLPADRYIVEATSDGQIWEEIAHDIKGTSYQWKPAASLPVGSTYKLRVRSGRGHTSEMPTTFTLGKGPAITQQPEDYATCTGQPIALTVVAEGAELKYKWKKDGIIIAGQTSATLSLPAATPADAGKYSVEVSGKCSPMASSRQVTVSLGTGPAISQQPQAVVVAEGSPFALSVTAAGPNLSYAWTKDGAEVAGATTRELKVAQARMVDNGNYVCTVKSACGDVVTESAKVTVTAMDVSEGYTGNIRLFSANPVSDEIRVMVDLQVEGSLHVQLIDVTGVKAYSTEIPHAGEQMVNIPVSHLAAGMYILDLQCGSTHRAAMISISH